METAQTFILSREALPEEIQKIVDDEAKVTEKAAKKEGGDTIPFEPGRTKKKAQG